MKIFCDLIWMMRGSMKADHDFYKSHGVCDFPQKQRDKMLMMCVLSAMVCDPQISEKMGNKMREGMVAPYQKVLAAAKPKEESDKQRSKASGPEPGCLAFCQEGGSMSKADAKGNHHLHIELTPALYLLDQVYELMYQIAKKQGGLRMLR